MAKKTSPSEKDGLKAKTIRIHPDVDAKVNARIQRDKSKLRARRIASFNGVAGKLLEDYGEGRRDV